MLIHLIRHTTPKIQSGICYGSSNLELADTFTQERDVVLSKLADQYDAIFTSPLIRCLRLSDFINCSKHCIDDRLKEYDFGDWELKPWSELNTEKALLWMDNFVEQAAPNGDSLISMKKRVDAFWQELINSNFEKVAIVSHAGVLRLIHGHILETPLNKLFRLQLSYGAVLEIQHNSESGLQTVKHI